MANAVTQFRGNLVPQSFLDDLAAAVKSGASAEGATVTTPNADLVRWLEWRGVTTVQAAYETGRALGRYQGTGEA